MKKTIKIIRRAVLTNSLKNGLGLTGASLCFLLNTNISYSQQVGIGTMTPTHKLHVVDSSGGDPLRVQRIGFFDKSIHKDILITDTAIGVIKVAPIDSLITFFDIDSINFLNDTLSFYQGNNTIKVEVNPSNKPIQKDTSEFFSGEIDYDGDSIFGIIIIRPITTSMLNIDLTHLNISEPLYMNYRINVTNTVYGLDQHNGDDYVRYNTVTKELEIFNQYGANPLNSIRVELYYKK